MGLSAEAVEREPSSIFRKPAGRISRAERREQADASVSTVKFPWGLEARLLNISDTGALFESGTRVPPASCERLTLCGPDTEIEIPVNFVRSEVAYVNGLGVKYHIAVTFAAPLELTGVRGASSAAPVRANTLSHLLAQLGNELDQAPGPDRREAVERAVRHAFGASARDVRIQKSPSIVQSADALEFPLTPGASASDVLRIDFAPGLIPTEADRRLSRAAARLAAAVLEYEQGA